MCVRVCRNVLIQSENCSDLFVIVAAASVMLVGTEISYSEPVKFDQVTYFHFQNYSVPPCLANSVCLTIIPDARLVATSIWRWSFQVTQNVSLSFTYLAHLLTEEVYSTSGLPRGFSTCLLRELCSSCSGL